MRVRDAMTTDHRTLAPDAILRDAVALLHAEASDLMVAHADGCLVGVLSEGDLIRALLPDRAEVVAAGGSVEDAFDAFVRKGEELRTRPIAPYVIRDPLTLSPDDHVGVAAVIFVERQIRRLPVVDHDRLVGTLSRGDTCRAMLGSASP